MELPISHAATIWLLSLFCMTIMQPVECVIHLGNETDRLALLEFKSKIGNYGLLSLWNDSINFCKWQGVTCSSKHQRVQYLNLGGQSLFGTISPSIGNLTFLRYLNLVDNRFYGEIPSEVGQLFRLRQLSLTNNSIGGEIPVNISRCSELRIMELDMNSIVGKIPAELGSLKKLVTLFLGKNNLTGKTPYSFGNFSSLKHFSVAFNNMEGDVPNELGQLKDLTFFAIGSNNLTGMLPLAFFNILSITLFSTAHNQLSGSLPANIGLTLRNLQQFGIAENQFHGSIPVSFTNASQLEIFDIGDNFFTGQVPYNLGNFKGLQRLNLELNSFGFNTSQDLSFLTSLSNCSNLQKVYLAVNNFGGELPTTIANLSAKLNELDMGENQISGRIPEEISNLVNLYLLGLEGNIFSGPIPNSFGKLGKLQGLDLGINMLSGEIPSSIGNITDLYELYLDGNRLEGNITPSIGNCQNLNSLDISENNLIGNIPQQIFRLFSLSIITLNFSRNLLTGVLSPEVGNIKSINALDVSKNKLSGEIPKTIGNCLSLENLHMWGNFLRGPIPSSLASLKGLQHLDLSRNNLSGHIPKELEKLLFLNYLNLSFNNLEGEVPKKGVFSNASALSLVGNSKLCGGIPELQLPPCPIKQKKHKRVLIVIILTISLSSILFLLAITSLWVFYRRKSRKHPSSSPFVVDKLLRISYKELLQATGGFSSDNLIGQGSFGSVYKGSLDLQGERLIAVKVLNLQQHGASKSFTAECKALGNIRHRNLVKILTYCSSIDFKGNDFKALVFDFMENGSLEMWLHPKENDNTHQPRKLNLLQRFRIAVDVSSALHYLHDRCEMPIIHCDLKPSSILLHNDMTAYVGDFGLAKLLSKTTNNSSQGQTSSSIGIKGTIGYMAPEYGIGSKATTHGDVFSFGIILLEIFTGRRPTDELFTNGLNLHNFVRAKLQERQVMQVLDPMLISIREMGTTETMEDNEGDDDQREIQEDDVDIENLRLKGGDVRKCIVSVLKIGLACSAELPGDRMNIRDVTRKLNIITEAFLGARNCRGQHIRAHQ